jgi:UDP-2,3-diacylglucosamine hydrolase
MDGGLFPKELNIPVYHDNQEFTFGGKTFYWSWRRKRTWRQRIQTDEKYLLTIFAFRWLHPDIGVRLAQYLSVKNKLISGDEDVTFLGKTTNG